jgi:hypothetical protein
MNKLLINNTHARKNITELSNNYTIILTFETFNWESYINTYEDLRKANIDTKEKAWNHWIKWGKKEGRTFDNNYIFDWESYINNYEDLRKANIDTKEKAWNHWIKHGKKEGRTFDNNYIFDWESYINNYEDLRKANIDTKEKAWNHWIKHGKKEGRTFDSFELDKNELDKNELDKNVVSISHSMGGGTQIYINNLIKLYNNINYEINIDTEELFNLKHKNISKKYNSIHKLSNIISNNTIILFNHLLTKQHTINKKIFYNIYNNCKYKKIIFIIHDYYLLYPNNPNPIKNKHGYPVPDSVNLEFTNDVFSKCDLIVFNSYNCINNFKKYINFDNFKYIITNTTPDIITCDYNIYPAIKSVYNIGILGHIYVEHKGFILLNNISKILPEYNFKVFGVNNNFTHQFISNTNIHLCGEYNNDNIFELIDEHKIDFFMFISVFEETYSFVLSIAMQTGLPIFYNDIGCYSERLYGRKNIYAFDEKNLSVIRDSIRNMETQINNNTNNYNVSKKKSVIYNNNADFNWILENNKYVFDISIIDEYIINNNVCFIHFTNIGNGYDIFLEQINNIKSSGLYNILDFIFISILGPHIKLFNDPKFKVIYYSSNELEWEFPTIKLIKSFADNINKKVNILYIHTKGVLNKPDVKEWREYLEHFLINNHKICLHYLNDCYDCVGVNINLHPKYGPNKIRCHFSGNFWWSNTNYIKHLILADTDLEKLDRYSTEHFIIGKIHSQNINIISLHNCENNLYKIPILPKQYNYNIIKNQVIIEYNNFNINNYKKTICIYFISTIEFSEYRFFKQIDEMIKSGFYDACEQLLCFITGTNANIQAKLSSLNKVQIIQTPNNEMEKYCLNNYKKYIIADEYNVVYLHTKGASHSNLNEYINDWCKICNYFTINLWKLNIILLQYYSCIGINIMKFPLLHFSGNNWWATDKHVNNLKEPIGNKYLDPEMYILNSINIKNNNDKIYQPNPLCLFKSIGNHAGKKYDEQLYKNLSIEEILERVPTNYIYNNTGDNIPINLDRVTII